MGSAVRGPGDRFKRNRMLAQAAAEAEYHTKRARQALERGDKAEMRIALVYMVQVVDGMLESEEWS